MKANSLLNAVFISIIFFAAGCCAAESLRQSDLRSARGYIQKNGFVPDKATAVSIAIAVLVPIYGIETIEGELPFVASLKGGVWTIVGSLPSGHVGGVAEVEISKETGKILRVIHTK